MSTEKMSHTLEAEDGVQGKEERRLWEAWEEAPASDDYKPVVSKTKVVKPKKLKKKIKKRLRKLLEQYDSSGVTAGIQYVPDPDLWYGYFVLTLTEEDIAYYVLEGLEPGQVVRYRIASITTDKIEIVANKPL